MGQCPATTGQLFRVDFGTKKAKWLAHAADFEFIRSGPHAGELLVNQRRWKRGEIWYEWWYYSTYGRKLAYAGPDGLRIETSVCSQWK